MQKKTSVRRALTPVLFALALICLFITLSICRRLGVFDGRYAAVSAYADLLGKIEDIYIGEYDVSDVSAAAMHASVGALEDIWSYYMTPAEYISYIDSINNRYAGIGVGVLLDDNIGGMKITFVYRGSAAETAGLKAGDVIIGIDGSDVTHMDLDEMTECLVRPIGDSAELTVMRADGGVGTLTVVYSYIFVDPVSFEMLADGIGYIALSNFDKGAAKSFIAALEELLGQGAEAFVFDVRGNGGGMLAEMVEILDYLLPEGEIFVAVDKSGRETVTLSGPDSIDLPFAVLIDRYSFSAAEYFAAMLREYDRAILVGEQTTGKNRMQTTVEIIGGGALHISSNQYLTKNRVSLYDEGGVIPDYTVTLSDDDFLLFVYGNLEKDEDPQLRQAISLLTAG